VLLVTHNHLAEENFLKGVWHHLGLRQAWRAAKSLNEFYRKEREFWLEGARQGPRGVNIAPKKLILEPMTGFQSQARSHSRLTPESVELWVPGEQVYHYYAAFGLSLKLLREAQLPPSLLPRFMQALGLAYKSKTDGPEPVQMDRMKLYYEAGAQHALRYSSLVRE